MENDLKILKSLGKSIDVVKWSEFSFVDVIMNNELVLKVYKHL